MVTHAQILTAVRATGDAEYLDWVAEPDDYAASRVEQPLLDAHVVLQVMPGHTSHPMHFLVAANAASGDVFVLTGQPASVGRLIQQEPRLAESDQLPRHAFELLTDAPDESVLYDTVEQLPAEVGAAARAQFVAPRASQGVDGWELNLTVRDDMGRIQVWKVVLPWQGEATWSRTTIATIEEEEMGP